MLFIPLYAEWQIRLENRFLFISFCRRLELAERRGVIKGYICDDFNARVGSLLDNVPNFTSTANISPHKAKLIIPRNFMEFEHAASKIQALSNNLPPQSVHKSYKEICDLITSELLPSGSLIQNKCSHPWYLNQLKHDLRYYQKAWLRQKNNAELKLFHQTLQLTKL